MLKKILISASLCGMVPFAASCGDEDRSNYQEPPLFEQVKLQLEFIDRDTSCSASDANDIYDALDKYKKANKGTLATACGDEDIGYRAELANAKGSSDKLATEMKNSGYYAAIYIFIAQMSNTLKKCPKDPHDVEALFEKMYSDAGCESLIKNARDFYKTWGASY